MTDQQSPPTPDVWAGLMAAVVSLTRNGAEALAAAGTVVPALGRVFEAEGLDVAEVG